MMVRAFVVTLDLKQQPELPPMPHVDVTSDPDEYGRMLTEWERKCAASGARVVAVVQVRHDTERGDVIASIPVVQGEPGIDTALDALRAHLVALLPHYADMIMGAPRALGLGRPPSFRPR
jgi:hypothetical protein